MKHFSIMQFSNERLFDAFLVISLPIFAVISCILLGTLTFHIDDEDRNSFGNLCKFSPCKSGELCENYKNSFICRCKPGFTGENCKSLIHDNCQNFCQNGGTCLGGENEPKCFCPKKFKGRHCEQYYEMH